ncbi:MAG: hypothetical protein K6B72_06335 [Lachnospiraceae bacterium]|nr:hypothetical protein [Lachnospiraceae bacterium]
MLIKRTAFSDFLWGAFVILLAVMTTLFWYFSHFLPDESKALLAAILAALTMVAVGLVTHAAGRLSDFLHRRVKLDPAVLTILYIVVMSILYLVMLLVRIRYLTVNAERLSDENGVFAGAMIVSGDTAGSGGLLSRITAVLLGVFLRIAGNRLTVACTVLAVVQVIAIVNATMAVRLLAGRAAGFASAVLSGFLPVFLENLLTVSEKEIFYLLFSLGFLLVALYLHMDARGALTTMLQLILIIAVGIVTGFLIYIDLGSVLLLLPLVLTVCLPDTQAAKELVRFFLMLMIAVVMFFVLLIIGHGIGGIGSGLAELASKTFGAPTQIRIFHLQNDFYPFAMVLVTLMVTGVVATFRDRARDRMSFWFLVLFEAVLLAPLFGESCVNTEAMLCFCYAAAASAGIGCIAASTAKTEKRERKVRKEIVENVPKQQGVVWESLQVPDGMVLPAESEADGGEARMNPMAAAPAVPLGIDRGEEEMSMAAQQGQVQEQQLDKAAQKALAKARKAQAKADAKAAREAARAAKRAEKERLRMLEDEDDDDDEYEYEEVAAQTAADQNVPPAAPVTPAAPAPAPAAPAQAAPAPAEKPAPGPISLASSPFMGRAPQTSQPTLIRNTASAFKTDGDDDDFDFDINDTDDFDV